VLKTPQTSSKNTPSSYSRHPWKCDHRSGKSELAAFVETSGSWETVAIIQPTSDTSAQTLADFMEGLINNRQQYGAVLDAAREALEEIINTGLNFSTEEEAEEVIARIEKLRPSKKKSQED
jgi:hypothetical protein